MESGTIEQTLPGLEGRESTPAPQLSSRPRRLADAAEAARCCSRAARTRSSRRRSPATSASSSARSTLDDVRERRDVLPLRGVDPRRRHVHRPDRLDAVDRRAPDGAADHDQRREARLGEADHGRHPAGTSTRARTRSRSRASRSPRRLVADLLQTAGADRVLTMDLHAGQIQGFFRIPVDHMTALPMFAQYFRDYLGTEVERVAVAPDTGRAKLAGKFAEMIGGGFVDHEQGAPGPRPGEGHGRDRRRRRQGRCHDRRRHRHRRDALRRRARRSARRARHG